MCLSKVKGLLNMQQKLLLTAEPPKMDECLYTKSDTVVPATRKQNCIILVEECV